MRWYLTMNRSLEEFRDQFPITRSRAYLFNGALAPAATPVRQALDRWADTWSNEPLVDYDRCEEELDLARGLFGRVVGADADEVAVLESTSRGANLAVELLAGRPGTSVLVDETTYPSSLYPWSTLTGLDVRFTPTSSSDDPSGTLAAHVDRGPSPSASRTSRRSPGAATICGRWPMRFTRSAGSSSSMPHRRPASRPSMSRPTAWTS